MYMSTYMYNLIIDNFTTIIPIVSILMGTVYIYNNIYSTSVIADDVKYIEHLYEYKYIDQLKEQIDDEIDDELVMKLSDLYIVEETPSGKVIMCYNKEAESFCYYSDNKNIPYKYLETVARLYVINNNCELLYIHMADELNNAKKRVIDELETQKQFLQSEEETDCVFVQFKQYNLIRNDLKNALIKTNANRYSKCGTLKDYSNMIEQSISKTVEQPHKDISFAEFKRNMKNK